MIAIGDEADAQACSFPDWQMLSQMSLMFLVAEEM
jgi:hypothetical protein